MTSVLIAQYRLPFPLYMSGADRAILTFASYFIRRGLSVDTLYCSGSFSLEVLAERLRRYGITYHLDACELRFELDEVGFCIVPPDVYFSRYEEMIQMHSPDWVWHHNPAFNVDDFERFFELESYGGRHFFYVQSVSGFEKLVSFKDRFDLFVSNSPYTQQLLSQKGVRSDVILPLPDPKDVVSDLDSSKRHLISMVNPIPPKGGDLVFELAKRLPERRFLVVYGWGYGAIDELAFDRLDNVIAAPSSMDLRPLYGHSRLLLVPSRIPEGFGRIPFEAALNGIPVIQSDAGALDDFFMGNGMQIESRYATPNYVDAWMDAIAYFDDSRHYLIACENTKELNERYPLSDEVDKFVSVLN